MSAELMLVLPAARIAAAESQRDAPGLRQCVDTYEQYVENFRYLADLEENGDSGQYSDRRPLDAKNIPGAHGAYR